MLLRFQDLLLWLSWYNFFLILSKSFDNGDQESRIKYSICSLFHGYKMIIFFRKRARNKLNWASNWFFNHFVSGNISDGLLGNEIWKMKLLNLALLAKVFATVDIDEELALTGIEPGSLLMRSPPRGLFNSTGPALKQKIFELQTLYQEHKTTGLSAQKTSTLLQIRKLLQLKSMVMQLLDDRRWAKLVFNLVINTPLFDSSSNKVLIQYWFRPILFLRMLLLARFQHSWFKSRGWNASRLHR